jgi:MFS family permease
MTPYRWQLAVLFGCVAGFFALMLIGSPDDHFVYLATTTGLVVAPLLASRLGRVSTTQYQEPVVVMLLSCLGITMPAAAHFPIERLQWPAIGLATVGIQGLWAIHRYEELPPAPGTFRERLRFYVTVGLVMAFGLSLLASLIFVLGGEGRGGIRASSSGALGLIVLGYFVGAVLAAALLAAMVPLTRWPLGTIFVGILCGALIYGAVAPAVSVLKQLEGEAPMSWMAMVGIALACGTLAGPPAALGLKYQV